MHQAGVEVRPLREDDRPALFTEVFLERRPRPTVHRSAGCTTAVGQHDPSSPTSASASVPVRAPAGVGHAGTIAATSTSALGDFVNGQRRGGGGGVATGSAQKIFTEMAGLQRSDRRRADPGRS
ncbi:MAG: hypothetical protein R2713_01140 [Ilumatobacteraceae bacterium]